MSWLSDVIGNVVGSLGEGTVKSYLTGVLRIEANRNVVNKTGEGELCVLPLPNSARSPWLAKHTHDGKTMLVRVAGVVTETVTAAADGKSPRAGYVSKAFDAQLLPGAADDGLVSLD